MHECHAMQILETKEKKKHKNQRTMVTKDKAMKHKDHVRKDSVSLSLLHPKLFRCTTSIGVCIHVRVISNSKIGIKVKCLY